MQIHFDLLKRVPRLIPQPEVDLRLHGRHLDVISAPVWFDWDEIWYDDAHGDRNVKVK